MYLRKTLSFKSLFHTAKELDKYEKTIDKKYDKTYETYELKCKISLKRKSKTIEISEAITPVIENPANLRTSLLLITLSMNSRIIYMHNPLMISIMLLTSSFVIVGPIGRLNSVLCILSVIGRNNLGVFQSS